jgi:hypothetical protein
MKRILCLSLILILLAGASLAQGTSKSSYAGVGAYSVLFMYDNSDMDETFGGYSITGGHAFSANFAARGHLYFTTHEDDSDLEINGYDIQAMLGGGLAGQGFKYYLLGGYFSESTDVSLGAATVSADFTGMMFGFGIGYTWESVTLDWWGSVRNSSDWDDFMDTISAETLDYQHGAGGLSLGFRF